MSFELPLVTKFKERLLTLSREDLIEVLDEQNPYVSEEDPGYKREIELIEDVFENRLTHLTWDDGTPVDGRKFTIEELASLVDPKFQFDRELAQKFNYSKQAQEKLHVISDPILWGKTFLNAKPRVYQALVLRNKNINKVLRWGRRSGKTFTMSLFLLWYSYTRLNGKCIVMAPMKTQVGVIYDSILEMAETNPEVQTSIVRAVASPQYEIDFSNGSTIKLFTTGMKSNSKSDVIRGQEAHVIVLDEMDYMGPDDLVAVMPMLQKTKAGQEDKILIAASTPTGQRGMFWDFNHDPDFSSFWFPVYVNPLWDEKQETRARSRSTEMNYRHEYEADWGEDVDGVYPRKLVDKARYGNNWEYKLDIDSPYSFYTIGVDWDKYGAGVNVVVLQYFTDKHPDPHFSNKLRVAYREEIKKEEFTLTAAVERIIHLNRIFKPRHIYADKGYGEMQMEHLHLYGKEHPESKLATVAKAWAFNSSIEVSDPYTRQLEKKELKHFMVDNLRYLLEQEKILFTEEDDELYLQLISYVVVKRTLLSGKPQFGPGGQAADHAHDALLLAAFAFSYNYDDMLNPDYAIKAKAISNESFLPLFSVDSHQDEKLAEQLWDKGESAPVFARRAMSYNAGRRGSRSSRPIQRKMF